IYSYGCKLTFDSNVLEATGASSAGSLSETWGAPTASTASGEIQIGAAGSSALAGSGDLLWVNFHVKGGNGTSTTIHFDNFMFNEGSPAATTVDGLFTVSEGNAINKENEIPKEFSISQNYPNPFNPSTKIKYSLPQNSQVNITIYNINGKVVETIINNFQMQGTYEINWQGTDNENHKVPSGIYFYRIEAGHFIEIRKMTLVK
ncbi:T9SS type A sorting domain-containing protein, partial [candidate division KSB1 bacterium]|nr:T9SS type A sorting domain-containing protein [candidate division KSB1 bacterium]